MALESLAPDQRAVVQLVLQQGRSYEALARLLGISADAVRQRAQNGLQSLGAGQELGDSERGLVGDYLLGQQDEAEREEAQRLLGSSPEAHAWAAAVSEQLAPVARRGLPELPDAPAGGAARPRTPAPAPAVAAPEPDPVTAPEPEAEPTPEPAQEEPPRSRRQRPRRQRPDDPAPPAEEAPAPAEPERTKRQRRERPQRPRREAVAPRPVAADATESSGDQPAPPPASRLGGILLIAALGILVAILVVYMVGRGGEDKAGTATSTTSSTATATTPQPLAQLTLRGEGGSKAEGVVQLNATAQGQVGFTLAAQNVPANSEGQAYAVWLIGKGKPARRLGFASPVGEDGTLATSGPRQQDQAKFVGWLQDYSQLVVSRETTEQTDDPTTVILRASLDNLGQAGAQGTATGTATPAP